MQSMTDQFQVTPLVDGIAIDLPGRKLGKARWAGLFPIVFGLFFSGFAIFWTLGAGGFLGGKGPSGWFQWLFMLWGVPFILVGLVPIGAGLAIFMGRSRIEITSDQLRHIEIVGPFRKQWRRSLHNLTTLRIAGGPVKVNDQPVTHGPLADLAGIRAEFADGKPMLLALGYSRPLMIQVAKQLARQMQARTGQTPRVVDFHGDMDDLPKLESIGTTADPIADKATVSSNLADTSVTRESLFPAIAVNRSSADSASSASTNDITVLTESPEHPLEDMENLVQPPTSKITVEKHNDGITFTIPPAGLFKGSHGLTGFAIIWLIFVGVFTGLMVTGGLSKTSSHQGHWVPIAVITLFWLVGLGMLYVGVSMGRRRAIIDIIGTPGLQHTMLLITTQSLGKPRQQDWRRDQISQITLGNSNMEVNEKPVRQLQIIDIHGKKKGYFTGRDETELYWLAAELRKATGTIRTHVGLLI